MTGQINLNQNGQPFRGNSVRIDSIETLIESHVYSRTLLNEAVKLFHINGDLEAFIENALNAVNDQALKNNLRETFNEYFSSSNKEAFSGIISEEPFNVIGIAISRLVGTIIQANRDKEFLLEVKSRIENNEEVSDLDKRRVYDISLRFGGDGGYLKELNDHLQELGIKPISEVDFMESNFGKEIKELINFCVSFFHKESHFIEGENHFVLNVGVAQVTYTNDNKAEIDKNAATNGVYENNERENLKISEKRLSEKKLSEMIEDLSDIPGIPIGYYC